MNLIGNRPVTNLIQDVDMSHLTSFKTGGIASKILIPDSLDSLVAIVKEYEDFIVIGGLTNVLVSDEVIKRPLVWLSKNYTDFEIIREADSVIVTACAGLALSKLSTILLKESIGGLEFGYGLPGSVGGAVKMNAGAYGRDMSHIVESCTVVTLAGEVVSYNKDELEFKYRGSKIDDRLIVHNVTLRLHEAEHELIHNSMRKIYKTRKESQPLSYPSAGSVFKNPEGQFAGALIDTANLKGTRVGGATISTKHANFIINDGGATSADIYRLIKKVRSRILELYDIELELEIKLIGAFE